MSLKSLRASQIQDYETNTFQRNVIDFSTQLVKNPMLDGLLLTDIAVSTTAVEVPHNLGRDIVGYLVVKSDAAVSVFSSTSTTPKVTVKLTADASATVNLWVF